MAGDKKKVYIDGQEYANLDEVPARLRPLVQQQLQGLEAERREPVSARRRLGLSGRAAAGGERPSDASLLAISGIAFLLLVALLVFLGR